MHDGKLSVSGSLTIKSYYSQYIGMGGLYILKSNKRSPRCNSRSFTYLTKNCIHYIIVVRTEPRNYTKGVLI